MSKKHKQRAADIKSRLLSNDEISPFSSIVLKEKKEEVKKKEVPIVKKKPSEIVGGYDANASFGDILFAYEHTGNPYKLPSQKKQKQIREMKTNFGEILDQWEGKQNKVKKPVEHQKSVNKVTKSFEEILNEYDGYKPAPVVKAKKSAKVEKKEVVHQKSINTVTKDFGTLLSEFNGKDKKVEKKVEKTLNVEQAPKINPFFISENEEDKRDEKAVWSIYGDNKPIKRVDEKPKKVEDDEKPIEIKKSSPYLPQKDFGQILGEYASIKESKKSFDEIKTELREEVKPDADRFFIAENDEDKRDKNAVWSIYGDNKVVSRREEKTDKKVVKEVEIAKSEPYKPEKDFNKILSEFNDRKEEVQTFEDIMKEKGDLATFERKYTINELRTMNPEATLDLHGYTEKEAKAALLDFLQEAKENKLRKISVIHGKGLHSKDGISVLKSVVELTLRESGMVSESFAPSAQFGGSGALWIILKEN